MFWQRSVGTLLIWAALAGGAIAREWSEPARGGALRKALMDALRPHAEWALGAPVQFVVHDLRVVGEVGFGVLMPQRPGGGMIDPAHTPMVQRGGTDASILDGVAMQVLYVRSGETWVALHWAIGATDVWWADPALCPTFSQVLPQLCPE